MRNDKFFGFLLWLTAIFIAGCAAFFSVRGIGLLFAGSMIPVLIMASSLEVGKLMTASFLYRAWHKVSLWLKFYLTLATVTLIGITSMGIYGFLSDAFSKTTARISFYETNIEQLEKQNALNREQISKIENSANIVDNKADEAIDKFQDIYDNYVADQRTRQDALNSRLKQLDAAVSELEASSGGLFSNKKAKLEQLKEEQKEERLLIKEQLVEVDLNIAAEYKKFLANVEKYRETTTKVDTRPDIDTIYSKIKDNDAKILKFKEDIQHTDIGSFKFIANSFNVELNDVVKWFIIIIVVVFDPLAVTLIIAYHVYTGKKQPMESDKKKTKDDSKAVEYSQEPFLGSRTPIGHELTIKHEAKEVEVKKQEAPEEKSKMKVKISKKQLDPNLKYLTGNQLRDYIKKHGKLPHTNPDA
tara:strand:- start:6440 stop:7684 length:1245 start_codon:yes stop_codon:yes gene_type:complete